MRSIKQHFLEAREAIDRFLSDDRQLAQIEKAGAAMVNAIQKGGKIISCGNGGSMCDAMHFAEELSGRFRNDRKALPAIAISDASHITCSANDYGFEHIFSRYVEALGREGDVLLAISTSGNSANIVEAVKAAQAKGMTVVGLTGKTGGKMAGMDIIEIRAPYSEYADRAQEIHIKVIHSLIDHIERQLV